MNCPACDREVIEDALFCHHCGARVSSKMICQDCKKDIPDSSFFCPYCGCRMAGKSPRVDVFDEASMRITMHCPECGKHLAGKLICGHCGSDLPFPNHNHDDDDESD